MKLPERIYSHPGTLIKQYICLRYGNKLNEAVVFGQQRVTRKDHDSLGIRVLLSKSAKTLTRLARDKTKTG